MDLAEAVRKLAEAINATATAKNVYGDPVTVGQRTIVPVAKFRMAFGVRTRGARTGEAPGGKGGGGGRIAASPCGVVEVSSAGARFVPFREKPKLALAAAAGFLLGALAVWSVGRVKR